MAIFETLAGIGGGLLTGALNNKAAKDMAQTQWGNEKLMAQEGIRWRVHDSQMAGIHPLVGLGSQPLNFSPTSVGGNPYPDLGSSAAAGGASLDRAILANSTAAKRRSAIDAAQLALGTERSALENELLRTQIKRLKTELPPPVPGLKPSGLIGPQGEKMQSGIMSDAEDVQKKYDDFVSGIWGALKAARDMYQTSTWNGNYAALYRELAKRYGQYVPGRPEWSGNAALGAALRDMFGPGSSLWYTPRGKSSRGRRGRY